MKKLIMRVSVFLITCSFLFCTKVFTTQVFASNEENFYRALQIDNNQYIFSFWGSGGIMARPIDQNDPNVRPIIIDGRAMVPLRAMANLVHYRDGLDFFAVGWYDGNRAVLYDAWGGYIPGRRALATFRIGSNTAVYYDEFGNPRQVTLPVAPAIIGGRTYLPLRAVADAVDNIEIEWVPEAQGIVIFTSFARPSNIMFPDGSTHRF